MLAIRSLVFKRCALLIFSITYNGEIMSPYSYYIKKGLVYITITDLSSCQPSSCFKYTKSNTYLLCNIHLIFFNKYMSLICFTSL